MNILIDKNTNMVVGVDTPATPLSYIITLPKEFFLSKVINEQEGEKQKTNEEGLPLFLKEVYRTEPKKEIIGRDEVLEDTGIPVMITVQKTNEKGERLYLENLYNENNEVIDFSEVIDQFDEDGTPNEPIMIDVQKTSVKGSPLFYKDIIREWEEKVFDHTEEVTKDETSTEDLEPIMIPNMVDNTYYFEDYPFKFNAEDILSIKYQDILERSHKDYILGDMFINEDDLDLTDPNHSANTGIALLELLPNGQAKTKTITLAEPSSEFEILDLDSSEGIDIYLSGKKFIDNKLTLASPVSSCTIKFINTTNKPRKINSYAIGY